ncbi:MAG: VWA domain-containing protein [Deltaproteobacteria bacterium]
MNRILRVAVNSAPAAISAPGWRTSFGLSALMHAAGLGILALIAISHPRPSDVDEILSELVPSAAVASLEIEPSIQTPVMRASSSGGRPGESGLLAAGTESSRPPEVRDAAFMLSHRGTIPPFAFEDRLPPATELSQSALGTKLGKGYALGGGFGSGIGDGVGNGSGSQFFELETAGTKFVYVLDGSASMTEPHSEARTRLERVKIELVRSIGGMPEQMEFFVIFFNRNSVPMPAEKLQPATLDNKRKYLEWCARVKGGGGTDPRAALKRALELEPDVIYLLTDGVFNPAAVEEVTRLNAHGVSIHTFCFGDAAGESLLKNIAQKNNGTYKFIP